MDFEFSPEEKALRQELRSFVEEELGPDWAGGSEFDSDELWERGIHIRKKMGQKRWLALAWPKEYGGLGAPHTMQLAFNEELAYHQVPGINTLGLKMLGPTLMVHGTEEQKKEYLSPLARGEAWWCEGYSEPEAGSDLASLQTRAVLDGDDFVINGSKIWTSGAHRADMIWMLVRTDPDAPKHRGISFIVGEMKTPGITVRPILNMAGEHHFNQVFFEDVRFPKRNLVGELNRGWYVGLTLLDFERSGIERCSTARRNLDDMVAFARETRTNGKPLSQYPMVRYRLADLAVEVETSRLLCYNVAWMQGQGLVPNREASISKLFASEAFAHTSRAGIQLLGLYGQLAPGSKWAPLQGRLERQYLLAISSTIAGGASEVQRNIIATRGLGLPRA